MVYCALKFVSSAVLDGAIFLNQGLKVRFSDSVEKDISDLKYAIHGNFITQGIAGACKLDVFDQFSSHDEVLSLEQLAKKTSTSAYALKKLLNFLVTVDLLSISPDGISYKITSKGMLLQKKNIPSLYHFALLHSTQLFRGASNYLVESIRDNKPGTSYFCDRDMFGYLQTNNQDSAVFNSAMADLTSLHADEVGRFVGKLSGKIVLDAGGGVGALLCAILAHSPNMNGIIVDLPNLKDAALDYVASHGFLERVSFVGKSFFEEFHSRADMIVIHHVLHDYDDETCVQILNNCKKSLTEDGSILIVETLLDEDSKIGIGWLKDMIMHVITPGGRVRSQKDFESLFDRLKLEVQQIYQMTSSDLSIIQLKPQNA